MTMSERDEGAAGGGPLVTVVVPTYNRAELIVHAVQSVIDQTYRNWELVIVDDGSEDRTLERLEMLGEPRLKVIRLSHCGKVARLRNIGAAAGSGDYIAFLDSDDLWHPERLEAQLSALRGASSSWCYADHMLVTAEGARKPLRAGRFRPLSGRIAVSLLRFETGVSIDTLLVPRSLFDEVGRFDEDLLGREDLDLVVRLAETADAVAVPTVLAFVRDHEGRTTGARRNNAELMAKVFRKAMDRSRDPVLIEAARAGWTNHLARAGGDRIGMGDIAGGGALLCRSFVHGAGLRHCLHCLASGAKRLVRSS